jgi:hypothetical protein
MRAFKWRVLLASTNVILAIWMSMIGLHEYETVHRLHPEYFYHGNLYYLPTAQIVSYCLNMPAYVASLKLASLGMHYIQSKSGLFTAHSFFYVYDGFYVLLAGFWWCVGWRLDTLSKPRESLRALRIVGYGLGALMSLALSYYGFVYRRGDLIVRALPVSMMIWGMALLFYFIYSSVLLFSNRSSETTASVPEL